MSAYFTTPKHFAVGATVNATALSKSGGTVKGQPDEDWRSEQDVVLVDWGGGNVTFVKAELLSLA